MILEKINIRSDEVFNCYSSNEEDAE